MRTLVSSLRPPSSPDRDASVLTRRGGTAEQLRRIVLSGQLAEHHPCAVTAFPSWRLQPWATYGYQVLLRSRWWPGTVPRLG